VKEQCKVEISNRSAALENVGDVDFNNAWESIADDMKGFATEIVV
jgi:hypothetical protein